MKDKQDLTCFTSCESNLEEDTEEEIESLKSDKSFDLKMKINNKNDENLCLSTKMPTLVKKNS